MAQLAVTTYDAVKAFHIMAVLIAFGVPLAYPLIFPYVRQSHPRAVPGLHAVQFRLNRYLTGPGTVLILVFGAYMASKGHYWGKVWVDVPLAILVVIGGVGGAVIVPASRQMAKLSGTDVAAAGTSGGEIVWSQGYEQVYRRYMAAEILLGALVLIAVFFMAAKPFA